ncbi:hypothetical protein JCM19301_2699 [Jejuia pallidilutea]|uniref:Uncharacterized protein n=1 Tax=Jejuia pallidilutea TaxID=504487 RepID=A0A090WIN2_9FLAO|nr:hypothetical protein JCM19301_2699 [Jejuia pallidilutea]
MISYLKVLFKTNHTIKFKKPRMSYLYLLMRETPLWHSFYK